tara:strand:- start:44 stop:238 length:195 start_codon:yes stop_codon:yes gene_type:complete
VISKEEVEVKETIADPPKGSSKTEIDILIEELKAKKPQVYETYIKAIEAQKRAFIYPDLTVRIG